MRVQQQGYELLAVANAAVCGLVHLSGQLPVEWSALANLWVLYLHANQLSGQLPVEWSALFNLEGLDLHDNQLSGQLPVEWSALAGCHLII